MKTTVSRLVLALAIGSAMPSLAFADSIGLLTSERKDDPALSAPAAVAESATAEQAAAPVGPDAVELAALYYYAQEKQEDRVEAEVARLRLKFPAFVMPGDVYQPEALQVDETELWALYEKDAFAAIDASIVKRKTENPDWSPSADFTDKLARRKTRFDMTAAVARKDWMAVAEAGRGIDPDREAEVDLVWMLIDAYAETGAKDALAKAYRGLLFRTENRLPDDAIVTTLQKATRDFPAGEVRQAIAALDKTPVLEAGIQTIGIDLLRGEVSAFNADKQRREPLPEADIARLRSVAEAKSAPRDLALLGWYDLKIERPADAEIWFRSALSKESNADNAKGLYLSLAAQGNEAEAYAIAEANLEGLSGDPQFLMNALSLRFSKPNQPDVDEKTVRAYSTAILQNENADHAEILAWYAYNSRQFEAAKAWFEKAIDWENSADRIKGLALSLQRLGMKQDFAELRDHYAEVYPDIWSDIKVAKVPTGSRSVAVDKPRRSVDASYLASFKAKRFGACVEQLAAAESRGSLSADAQLIKGWCHLGLNRLAEARSAFGEALQANGRTREDAAYGSALTLLRGKLTDDAEALIGLYPLSSKREREVRAEIYWQRARSAFDHKQYQRTLDALNARASLVAEPVDLSQLRGWSHYYLGNKREANAVFERLKMHLYDTTAARGFDATVRTR